MTDEPINPVKEEAEAIKRLSFTADGQLFHRYLRRVLEHVLLTPDGGALQAHTGRRTLARDLMGLMAEGIESAGRQHPADQPILARQRQPVAVDQRRGLRRRVNPDPDLRFADQPADDEPAKPAGGGTDAT